MILDRSFGHMKGLGNLPIAVAALHEIDHVVNDSADSSTAGIAGECENHINQMRRECNLPLRTDYFFTFFPRGGKRFSHKIRSARFRLR